MKGLVFLGDRKAELRNFPDPVLGPSEVVIEMKASGLCGSDLPPYRMTPTTERPAQNIIRGHEPCGQVVEVGHDARFVKVGDRVMIHHYTGCGHCKWCMVGYRQMCIDPNFKRQLYGSGLHGGHADRMVVLDYTCVPMPDELSYEEGAILACGTGTAYDAIKKLDISGRDTLAIYGQGPVGLSALVFAVDTGARVIVVEPVPYRQDLAKSLGADIVINPMETDPVEAIKKLTHGEGADAALDATGRPEPRAQMVKSARIFGRACFVGEGPSVAPTLNPSADIIHKQLTVRGSWTMSTVGLLEMADYVVDHKVPLKKLITHRFPLEQGVEAYKIFDAGLTGKAVFAWT